MRGKLTRKGSIEQTTIPVTVTLRTPARMVAAGPSRPVRSKGVLSLLFGEFCIYRFTPELLTLATSAE